MFEKVTKSPGSHFLDSKKTYFPFYIFKFSEACTEIQKWIVLQMTNGSSQARESKAADKRNAKSKFFVSHIVNSKSMSELAHSWTIFPCYLGMEINEETE